MTLTELPWLLFGRRVRPYAFFVSLATLVIAWTLLIERNGPGQILDGHSPGGLFIGSTALLAFLLLHVGYWSRNVKFLETGMLFAAGAWMGRAVFVALDAGIDSASVLLSLCWAGASVGAFLLEVTTGQYPVRHTR